VAPPQHRYSSYTPLLDAGVIHSNTSIILGDAERIAFNDGCVRTEMLGASIYDFHQRMAARSTGGLTMLTDSCGQVVGINANLAPGKLDIKVRYRLSECGKEIHQIVITKIDA